MPAIGDQLYSNLNGNKIFYNAFGVVIELAPLCLALTDEVLSVDANGRPSSTRRAGTTSTTTTTTPTVPSNAWLDSNNLPILDSNNEFILLT